MIKALTRVLLLTSIMALANSMPALARIVNLAILHTNDSRGRIESFYYRSAKPIGGFAKRATFFEEKRRHKKMYWLTLDAGNIFGLAPYSYYLEGTEDVKLMKWLGYDAVGLGTLDFIFGPSVLKSRIKEASFPFICANVVDKETGKYLSEPFKTLNFDGFRIGIFGVIDKRTPEFYSDGFLSGLEFKDPSETIAELAPQLKGISDAIILLSTLPLSENITIADSYPQISVIVSGGEGSELAVPIKVGNTLIVQAGKWGMKVGLLKLTFEGERDTGFKLRYFDESLVPMDGKWVENTKYLKEIYAHRQELEDKWSVVVGKISNSMDNKKILTYETELGDLFTDAMRQKAMSDLAIVNGGAFRGSLSAGSVTRSDIYRVFPGDSFLAVGKVSGENLVKILSQSASQAGKEGFLQVSGVTFGIYGNKAYDITVGNEPLSPDKQYTVAFPDNLLEGSSGLSSIVLVEDVKISYDLPIRKVLENFLSEKEEFGNEIEERISYYAAPPAEAEAKGEELPPAPAEEVPSPPTPEGGEEPAAPPEAESPPQAPQEEVPESAPETEQPGFEVSVEEEVDVGLAEEEAQPPPPTEEEAKKAEEAKLIGESSKVEEEVEYYLRVEEVKFDGSTAFGFTLTLRNTSESHKLFTFPSSQIFDFAVYDGEDIVWRYSYNRYFIQKETKLTLAPLEERSFTVYWDGLSNMKVPLEAKLYKFVGVLKAVPEHSVSFTGLFQPPVV